MSATLHARTAAALRAVADHDPRTDAELLRLFLAHDSTAFAALVQRHGPLVYGVCRRALGATADADDAFQATFLVLVQKAGSIPWRANLGPWLFGVAQRIAQKARFKRDRRFAVEKQVDAMPHPESMAPDRVESDELSRAFDEELTALPEEMRRAVVLCELQGRSRQQAAKELRVSEGTLSSRLARARKLLRDRLTKRGFGLVIPTTGIVSAKLTAATVGLANGSAGVVPAAVWELTQEALKAMTISKLKLGAVLAAVAVGFTGYGLTAGGGDGKTDPQVKPASAVEKAKAEPVATINGQDVSRAEFGEYLIRKHGAKEIEAFVNKKIIEAEATKRGVSVTDAEVEEQFSCDGLFVQASREDFVRVVLPKYGKTEAEWREDVIRPRLTLQKLIQDDVKATDDDLKKLFERKYGEKRKVQMILWGHEVEEATVRARYADAKGSDEAYHRIAAGQANSSLASVRGHIQPLSRHMQTEDQVVEEEAFKLKIGEVSNLIKTKHGHVAVKLIKIVPPQKDKKFEEEKVGLMFEATREKLDLGTPKHFAKLKEEAKPVYHIQPEPKTYPVPVPLKK